MRRSPPPAFRREEEAEWGAKRRKARPGAVRVPPGAIGAVPVIPHICLRLRLNPPLLPPVGATMLRPWQTPGELVNVSI